MAEPLDPLAGAATGAEEACVAVETALREFLPRLLPADLDMPYTWEQLPTDDAMRSADTPALAITCSGLIGSPQRVDRGARYDALWSVWVTVWVRGEDGTYASTTSATRRYTKAARSAVLAYAHREGRDWSWLAEEYDALGAPNVAATLQAGMVQFSVPAIGAVDLSALESAALGARPDGAPLPTVTTTYVTVNPRE